MINFKRFISVILSLIMMLVMFESIPVYAKTGTETYTYEGYTVEYIVSNEWTGNQSVEVKITNTGEESILNWALKYDAKGEISGLWNAVSVSDEETAYLIKNSGYNYEIAPDESVSFGYTLSGENLSVPEKFELCSKRVDTKEENYNAVLDITEEWDKGFKGELIVSNVSDSPIEAWRFSFDSNFSVSDIWDCRLLENTDGRYTVASEAWINPIQPGSSVTIGIVGIKEEGKTPEISSVTLSEVVIDDTLPEVQKPVGEMFIAAFGEYIKETETIDILWMSTQTEGTFEILMSDDNEEYTVAGSVQNADNYSIPADFVKKYIKVRQTNGNQTVESEPFVVMITPTGYTVDFIDSDNDGLYDYIEDAVGTDKNLSDTDNDDLTDYEEVYLLGTDPIVYDSIVSGTSDGNADPDNDGLSNRYELDNGTNPLYDDTDSDGLTDGEEIGTYGTDPVKYDTDEDNIGDGDEITLGLNPLDSSTDGTPDSERIFEQKITSDSDIMSHINTEDNAFSMSIDISAAGNAENSISVSESGYSAVIQSDVVLGTIPEISYASGLSVEEVRVNFEIKDEYLENTLGTYSDCEELSGIKRLNIFRYFEEENILLPIETKFDIENNMVYTDVDMVGTYCLIDMEKWFENIGVDFESEADSVETYSELQTMSFDEMQMLNDNGDNRFYAQPYVTDLVYITIFEEDFCDSERMLNKRKQDITNTFKSGLESDEKSGYSRRAFIFTADGNLKTTSSGKMYAETIGELEEILSELTIEDTYCDVTNKLLDELVSQYSEETADDENVLLGLNEKCVDCVGFDSYYRIDKELQDYTSARGYQLLDRYIKCPYVYCLVSCLDYMRDGFDSLRHYTYVNILAMTEVDVSKPQIITATGLEPLPVDFDSKADYDNDGLLNTKEIDWNSPLIKDKSLKTYESLPTVQECIGYFEKTKELTYVGNGLERLQILPGSVYSELITKRILPINSDPLSVDGDGDWLLDGDYRRNDNNEIIAPIDEHPLRIDGPIGAWNKHIEEVGKKDDLPTKLVGYYECDDATGDISEIDFSELNITDSKSVYDFLKKYATGSWATSAGSRFLMFRMDDKKIALHSQTMADRFDALVSMIEEKYGNQIPQNIKENVLHNEKIKNVICKSDIQIDTWQRPFGYNNLYDLVFSYGTNENMAKKQFFFSEDGDDYVLWLWQGDYLNCGPGAEMGIYKKAIDVDILGKDIEHWKVADFNLPMTLNLYENQNGSYTTLFNWYPENPQWWITGFAYKETYTNIKNQVMIGSVDFSKHEEMYETLKRYTTSVEPELSKFSVFDDANKTIWLCWCEEVVK